jgi:hypothetical protein
MQTMSFTSATIHVSGPVSILGMTSASSNASAVSSFFDGGSTGMLTSGSSLSGSASSVSPMSASGEVSRGSTINSALGNVQQGMGLFGQAKGIFGKSSGESSSILGCQQYDENGNVPNSKNGGMLGGGGFKNNALGAASGAMGMYAAYQSSGGVGGALSGAMSGMQLGMAVGGPVGAAIGAGYGGLEGVSRGPDRAREQANQQLTALALQHQDVRRDFTASGYVFFPKGDYKQLQLLLVDSETGDTDVLSEPWN